MATKRSGNQEDREAAGGQGGGTARGAGEPSRGGAAKKSATGAGGATKPGTGGAAKKSTGGAAKKATGGGAGKTAATGRSGSSGARGTGGKASGGTGTKRAGATKRGKPNLRSDLRDFAAGRPQGWNHEDWMSFLEDLKARGHNIDDREAIGRALERERLDMTLEKVGGIGPKARKALVERFETVWSLRNADVDEIAQVGNVSRSAAEQIHEGLQQ